jgi:hypothetical protein
MGRLSLDTRMHSQLVLCQASEANPLSCTAPITVRTSTYRSSFLVLEHLPIRQFHHRLCIYGHGCSFHGDDIKSSHIRLPSCLLPSLTTMHGNWDGTAPDYPVSTQKMAFSCEGGPIQDHCPCAHSRDGEHYATGNFSVRPCMQCGPQSTLSNTQVPFLFLKCTYYTEYVLVHTGWMDPGTDCSTHTEYSVLVQVYRCYYTTSSTRCNQLLWTKGTLVLPCTSQLQNEILEVFDNKRWH